MNERQDFDSLVDAAMANPAWSAMRPVVEKELLHVEIFQALDKQGLLKNLVFQGGTALRLCWDGERFSEDLDFAGGVDFSAEKMERIKDCVEQHIGDRFGFKVEVRPRPAPKGLGKVQVDKWWITVETAPESADMPRQKIKLEVANIPAYTPVLRPLRAHYDSVRAMPTVLVNTESLDEIMADKIVAFPTSLQNTQGGAAASNEVKVRYRDLWDLAWLSRQGARPDAKLVALKVDDYGLHDYAMLLDSAIERIPALVKGQAFKAQMTRFIDSATVARMLATEAQLDYLAHSAQSVFSSLRDQGAAG